MVPALPTADAQLPEQWPQATLATPDAQPPLVWHGYFTDPRLQVLIREALQHNRDARIAWLQVAQAEALLTTQRADRWPTLQVGVNATRQPGSTAPYAINTVATAGVSVPAFELDLWGRVSALSEAAQADWLASQEAHRTVQIALVASVAHAYYSLWADQWQLALAHQTLETRTATRQLQQLRYDGGVINELDWRSAQAQYEAARVNELQAQRQWQQSLNAMAVLLGKALPADALPPMPVLPTLVDMGAVSLWPALADLPVDLPSRVLAKRPDVRAAEQALVAANAQVGAARAARFPRLSLTASGGVASDALSRLVSDGRGVWGVASSLAEPLLDAGRSGALVDTAQARLDIALARYEKTLQVAFREVADALVARSTWAAQLQAQQAQAMAETARFELVHLRYQTGVTNGLEWLDAQRSLLAAQQALIAAHLASQQVHIAVFKSLGGGLN
jgi:NodT family efflux transporter outer membrane factor (OMF) lipoprotein